MIKNLIFVLMIFSAKLFAQDVFVADSSGETSITYKPGNQKIIISGANGYRGYDPVALSHRTLNGGYTSNDWFTVQMPLPSGKIRSGDPTVDYDNNGNVYYCFTSFELESGEPVNGGIYLCKSTNDGTSWSSPIIVHEPELSDHDDKPWMVIDRTRTPNRIYVAWSQKISNDAQELLFSYALTTNLSFSSPYILRDGTVEGVFSKINHGVALAIAPKR